MWRDATKKELAAQALKITATDLTELQCVDEVVPEPEGGAHADHERAAELLGACLVKNLAALKAMPVGEMMNRRYEKFRRMAQFFTG